MPVVRGISHSCRGYNLVFPHCSEASYAVSDTENSTGSSTATSFKTWMCLICGWIYDEAEGDAEHDIAPGTAWADVPMNWTCPECGARKEDFEMVQI